MDTSHSPQQTLRLQAAFRRFMQTADLVDGKVQAEGLDLEILDVRPQMLAFRRMVREEAYDICELAPTTYIVAKSYGAKFTALPIFLTRMFHHSGLVVREDSGIRSPKQLEGRRLGSRAWSLTKGAWTKGILMNEFGVDISKITWVVDDEEHVTQLPIPSYVEQVATGKSLASMMATGEIDAAFTGNAGIGREGKPKEGWEAKTYAQSSPYRELWEDGAALEKEWYDRTGIYPFHGLIVVKDEVLAQHPWVAKSLYQAFDTAKQNWLAELQSGAAQSKEDQVYRRLSEIVGPDPLPYGIEANRPTIEALLKYLDQQGMTRRRMSVDELFIDCR